MCARNQRRGQGALEYLLLLAGLIFVSTVAFTLSQGTQTSTGQQVNASYSQIVQQLKNTPTPSPAPVTPVPDTTPPTVGLISPTSASVGVSTTYSATVTDNVWVSSCDFYWNGAKEGAMSLAGGLASYTKTVGSPGSYPNVYANCSDASGNRASGAGVSVGISDISPPALIAFDSNVSSVVAGNPVLHFAQWSDNIALSGFIFASNYSSGGSLVNDSWQPMPSSNWSNVTLVPSTAGIFAWKIFANDSSNNWASTTEKTIAVTGALDTAAPQYSSVGVNDSTPTVGEFVKHYTFWSDNNALSGFIFSSNYSGAWENESWVQTISAATWSNATKTLPNSSKTYGWMIYANDSYNNWNATPIQPIVVAPASVTSCGTLTGPKDYILTVDLNSPGATCLQVATSNVSIDCNGRELTGDGTSFTNGITISGGSAANFTVKNCIIRNFYSGIFLSSAGSNGLIENNTLEQNGYFGIASSSAKNVTVFKNTIINGTSLIYLPNSNYSNVSFNRVEANASTTFAISMSNTLNAVVVGNNVSRGNYGVYETGSTGLILGSNQFCYQATNGARCNSSVTDGGSNKCESQNGCGITCGACPDIAMPQNFNISLNDSTPTIGEVVKHSSRWTDNVALSGFIFSSNYTGTWENDSWTPMSGASNWSNVSKTLPSTVGAYGWLVYANDSSNNWNATPIQAVSTSVVDDFESGNLATWIVSGTSVPYATSTAGVVITGGYSAYIGGTYGGVVGHSESADNYAANDAKINKTFQLPSSFASATLYFKAKVVIGGSTYDHVRVTLYNASNVVNQWATSNFGSGLTASTSCVSLATAATNTYSYSIPAAYAGKNLSFYARAHNGGWCAYASIDDINVTIT